MPQDFYRHGIEFQLSIEIEIESEAKRTRIAVDDQFPIRGANALLALVEQVAHVY